MLDKFLTFITPGPLTEKVGFQTRVFTSWISLGFVLGLIFGIIALSLGTAAPNGALAFLLQYLISFPIAICLFGLIGLGLNSMRRGDAEYPGWYWYLFPIWTYIVIGFWLTVLLLGFFLSFFFALAGINVPSIPHRFQRRQSQFNPEQFRREVQRMKVEDLLKEFGKQFEEIENKNKLAPEEKKIVKKLRGLDRAALHSQLQDALSNDELEILFIILIKLLSGELR